MESVQYFLTMARQAAPMVERQLNLADFVEIASKSADWIRREWSCECFLDRSRTISHSLRLSHRVSSDSAMDGSLPAPHFDNGFLHLAAVVEAVRMWEAYFAFHICIACSFVQNSWEYLGFPKNP